MANTIILKKSSTASAVPAAGSLQPGELAINLADKKIYSKTTGGVVIQIAGSTENAITFNNGGAGAASGTTFNGLTAQTISYNTVGAPSVTGTNASGTWGISITGSSASCTGNAATSSSCSGNAATATLATKASTLSQSGGTGVAMTFNWSGQGGQPSWLWGGNDGQNMYVYNPSNFSVAQAALVRPATAATTTATDIIYQQIADNDFFRLRTGGDATNAGWVELATADDGNEPIYVRQYTGVFTTLVRTLTLLDGSGNTSIPGALSIGGNTALHAGNFMNYTVRLDGNPTSGAVKVYNGSASADVFNGGIEVREVNAVGATQSSYTYAPGVGFHWTGVCAAQLYMGSNGQFYFGAQTDKNNLRQINAGVVLSTGAMYASNWYRCYGATGLYNETYGRGIVVPDGTVSYGNMMAYGAGLNGWAGFSLSSNNKTNWMTDGNSWGMYNATATGWMMSSDMSGNVTFAGNVTAYSDLRLKHNVREIDEVTARRDVLASSAIMYEREGRTRIGYGAQYLRDRGCPEFVREADDALKLATGTGTLSVDYGETAAVLAVASKNTDDRVAQLEARIAQLEAIIMGMQGDLK